MQVFVITYETVAVVRESTVVMHDFDRVSQTNQAMSSFFSDLIINHRSGSDSHSSQELYSLLRSGIKRKTRELVWSGVEHDNNGILYWLATSGNQVEYENPHISEKIICTSDTISGGEIETLVGLEIEQLNTASTDRPWYIIDLTPSGIKVVPKHYRLGSGHNGAFLPRSWVLQGSQNGIEYVDISVHDNDTTLTVEQPIHTFPLSCTDAYTHFKLIQTGPNTYGVTLFMVCCFELYGIVQNPPHFQKPLPKLVPGNEVKAFRVFHPENRNDAVQDRGGLFNWIGTDCGRSRYCNPHRTHVVEVSSSGLSSGRLETFIGREIKQMNTASLDNSWFAVDITPSKLKMVPTAYRLGSGHSGSFLPRSWVFQGSNDGTNWKTIRAHVNDETLTPTRDVVIFDVTCSNAYTHFRIMQTADNSYGVKLLMVCCFELYGTAYNIDNEDVSVDTTQEVLQHVVETEGMQSILEGIDKGLFISKVARLIKKLKK